jgi:hypothetical protein
VSSSGKWARSLPGNRARVLPYRKDFSEGYYLSRNPQQMRALKTLLIILLAVVALAVVLGITGPKHSEVSRSAIVHAPVDVVYAHANSLQRMAEWSPWAKKDPAMKVTYSGTEGVVGQNSSWSGNANVGSGSQEITALEPLKKVGLALHFKEPFESEATSDLDLVPMGDSTKVTWVFRGDNNFVSRIYLAFNDHGQNDRSGFRGRRCAAEGASRRRCAHQGS